MIEADVPPVRELVLVGGGHAHVQVLRAFGMRPEPGVRLTLVSASVDSPYSGMLPGFVSGAYSKTDLHIDMVNLCRFAGARLIVAAVAGIDAGAQVLKLSGRPDLRFDLVSLNCGAVPAAVYEQATVVKPIGDFLPKWQDLLDKQPGALALIGGGAGGVELAFALRQALPRTDVSLVGPRLLSGEPGVTATLNKEFQAQQISWLDDRVVHQTGGELELQSGRRLKVDEVIWVTGVRALSWLAESALATDAGGFVKVDQHLRSTSHDKVFAVGDTAHLVGQEREKSGVFAVRQGPYLAANLRAALRGETLRTYTAQSRHLAILGLGDGRGLALRGKWHASGRLWWWLKQHIDRKFMRRFNDLPDMSTPTPSLPATMRGDLPAETMRCGGCGAKVAAEPLQRVLNRLPLKPHSHVRMGIGDDAAEIVVGTGKQLLTVDGFRAMVDDPYLFGRIATHHSLNDIFAMGGKPTAALALVTVPLMADAMIEEELYQLLSGVVAVLNEHEVALVGGHSAEAHDLSVGLTVSGEHRGSVIRKEGAKVGQHLILSKPLGTGVVLAAAMQRKINPHHLHEVLLGMDVSNAPAVAIYESHAVSALTDVTGFGLLGHLGEMLRAVELGASLSVEQVPFYRGICLFDYSQSSLQEANELNLQDYQLSSGLLPNDPRIKALMDPQTSGGLLGAVDAEAAPSCVAALKEAGYQAADIGVVTEELREIR